ncbi:MAG: dihydroorotate dehydrogenase [Actinobacteria bacterium]|nr:dihydroorotate dehydrogenase [Actinomycetota bacterium]
MGAHGGVDLRVELGGITLRNPVLVCSGTFGNGREMAAWMDVKELGGVMTKAVTLAPCAGNPPPRVWETPSGMLNAIGLENKGLERFLAEDLPWLNAMQVPVWVNVAGFTREEYVEVSREVSRSGLASALELNISCPNVKKGGLHFSAEKGEAARLVSEVKEVSEIPVYVKLSPNTGDIAGFAGAMVRAGADGISLINTIPAMAVDVETARPRLGNVTGGLSGPAVHPVAVRMVWEVAQAVDVPIIGMGGIWSWMDAAEMLMVGADAVAVGTLNFRDPAAALGVVEGLASFMLRKGYRRVGDMVDLVHRGRDMP